MQSLIKCFSVLCIANAVFQTFFLFSFDKTNMFVNRLTLNKLICKQLTYITVIGHSFRCQVKLLTYYCVSVILLLRVKELNLAITFSCVSRK